MTTAKDGSLARSYRPPYAVTCWVDEGHVHIEIPSKDPSIPPYIQRYALSEQGLSKALSAMKAGYKAYKDSGRVFTPVPRQPTRRQRGTDNFSERQREAARAVLKRMGLIGL